MVNETDGEHRRGERGFTLVELMIVIGVMFILAGIALPRYQRSVKFAKQAACAEDLYRLRQAIDQYHADQGVYPPQLEALKEEGYIREIHPDPFTGEDWIGIMEEETDDPRATPGIWDVRSPSNCGGDEDESEDDW